jgi:Zn-dependent protease with chaperone function
MFSFYKLLEILDQEVERKERLNEESIAPLIIPFIFAFFTVILIILGIYSASKVSTSLSNTLRKVTGNDKWKVRILNSPVPNAMALAVGGHTIFITKAFVKMLTERELIGVMLHEVKHMRTLDSLQSVGSIVGVPAILLGLASKYGKDPKTAGFASALDKMNVWVKKEAAKHLCGFICRLNKKVKETFDEHPQIESRIENILQKEEIQKAIIAKDQSGIRKFISSLKGSFSS